MARADLQRNKDEAMAGRMKKLGIRRLTGNCPICHQPVSLNRMYEHVATRCGARDKKGV